MRRVKIVYPIANSEETSRQPIASLIRAHQPNIVIETVKRAEDGNGVIVRLYESQRRRGTVTLAIGFALVTAWHTNLLEQNEQEISLEGQQITFPVRPYEIVTLRLIVA